MKLDDKILIFGGNGLVGKNLTNYLINKGYTNVISINSFKADLREYDQVKYVFREYKPSYVFMCAAKVGGIEANNSKPVDFLLYNMQMQNNVIENAYNFEVKKLLFLGSSCIYPKFCEQPIKEDSLLLGPLEETNQPYAIAKISGIELCKSFNRQYGTNFISVMPTNLYGPYDKFDRFNGHVIPALFDKFNTAIVNNLENVNVLGNGLAIREFLYIEDLCEALEIIMKFYDKNEIINIGAGQQNCISIKDLIYNIAKLFNYQGNITFDNNIKMNGTPIKKLDNSKLINLYNWRAKTNLQDGLIKTYNFYKNIV